jgi:ribosomal-protein-alanine N-acetyltransferase
MNVRNPLPPLRQAALTTGHLEACLALDQASLGGLWSTTQWQTELADPRRPGVGLWQGESLVAMASGWLVVDELHITLVAVAPGQRRRGLGRQVLQALLTTGRQQGAAHATLEVAAGNSAAVALYRCLGFQDAGLRRGYYRNGEDALIQWLRLPPVNDAEAGCG